MKSKYFSRILALLAMLAVTYSLPTTEQDSETALEEATELDTMDAAFLQDGRERRAILPAHCVDWLYVMAHTASHVNAGTNDEHEIQMVANGQTRTYILKDPTPPADGYERLKGDLWKIRMKADFGFTGCVNKGDITSIAVEQHSNDGWKIDSIITVLRDDYSGGKRAYEVATLDMDANRWIDGNGSISQRRFELNLVIKSLGFVGVPGPAP